MATKRTASAQRDLENLLRRDHTLLGGILFGIDGHIIEIQARAVRVLNRPASWSSVTNISGMAKGAIGEALSRISGAFAKLQIPPGEITLADPGVLFLDEITEFSRGTIEALRQPIEDGFVHLTRVSGSMDFPCKITLLAAMNPCSCGFFGSYKCKGTKVEVERYQQNLSGLIQNRIDLQVELRPLTVVERFAQSEDGISPRIQAYVERARDRQDRRYQGTLIPYNAAMPGGHVADYCQFSSDGLAAFKTVIGKCRLSTRSMDRLAKFARTIADLANRDSLEPSHFSVAKLFVVVGC